MEQWPPCAGAEGGARLCRKAEGSARIESSDKKQRGEVCCWLAWCHYVTIYINMSLQ